MSCRKPEPSSAPRRGGSVLPWRELVGPVEGAARGRCAFWAASSLPRVGEDDAIGVPVQVEAVNVTGAKLAADHRPHARLRGTAGKDQMSPPGLCFQATCEPVMFGLVCSAY